MRRRRRYYYNNFSHTNTFYSNNQKEMGVEIEKKKGITIGAWVGIFITIIIFTTTTLGEIGFKITPTIVSYLTIAVGIFAVVKNKTEKARTKKEGEKEAERIKGLTAYVKVNKPNNLEA